MPDLRTLRFLVFCLLVLLGGACAPSVQRMPDDKGPPPETAAPRTGETSFFSTKDAELFQRALSRLNAPVNGQAAADDYAKARTDLEALVNAYPKSRWRPAAEKIIALIDNATSQRQLAEKTVADKNRLAQENEQLKRQVRALNEKLQAETAALSQENEQLKKDIQTLKNLEIELEKRDRKLR